MNQIEETSIADIVFQLSWRSDVAQHTELYHAGNVNLWRDLLPPGLSEQLVGKQIGDRIEITLKPGEDFPEFADAKVMEITNRQIERRHRKFSVREPRFGRFYPRGILKDVSGIFPENVLPFRLVGIHNGRLNVDLNHPMAGRTVKLSATVGRVHEKGREKGGTSLEWLETISDGPGMQARWRGKKTDYFSDNPFHRDDQRPDHEFYEKPRFVQHLDDTAESVIQNLYGQHLAGGMHVLDLMASWQSHIPDNIEPARLTGIGLNPDELRKNARLTDFVVQDVNADPVLRLDESSYDAVICTVSVEYLLDPYGMYDAVSRLLRPQGKFIVTFSNRWFPPKAVRIWKELHDFERMGLVIEYFMQSGAFEDLKTYTVRGLPRPAADKYFPKSRYADPVYAVWGKKANP